MKVEIQKAENGYIVKLLGHEEDVKPTVFTNLKSLLTFLKVILNDAKD